MKKIWEELNKYQTLKSMITGILVVAFSCMVATGCDSASSLPDGKDNTAITTTAAEAAASEATEAKTEGESEELAAGSGQEKVTQTQPSTEVTLPVAEIPAYAGEPYVTVNNNVPQFLETDLGESSYEYYSDLDDLGRCGVVYACIGTNLMPTEERGEIGAVKPSGWHTIKYDIVDGKYLYNRCHLIGYQLSGENANVNNLITGTRYLNVEGMLPFENMVADYVKETGNHVLYRVAPVFEGDNLVASGVQIEAQSVEDQGEGILFNVYCYNVQPGVTIDYATGDSALAENAEAQNSSDAAEPSSQQENAKISQESSSQQETVTSSDENASQQDAVTQSSTMNSNEAVTQDSPVVQGAEENSSDHAMDASGAAVSNDTSAGGSGSVLVWKSATGSKYHSISNCGNMNPDNATQITEEEAIREGLGKCKKCW